MAFLLALFLRLSLFTGEAQASVGLALSVHGQAILHLKSSGQDRDLGPGMPVDAGDKVDTGPQASAKLHLIDETILDVAPASSLVIPNILAPDSRERQVLIEVLKGRIRAKVNREIERSKGRFEIHTYAASLGVEGTDFIVDVSPPDASGQTQTTVAVIEGQVAVTGSKPGSEENRVVLTAGMRLTVSAKVLGEQIEQDTFRKEDIQKLDKLALDELARKARLENETFLQSIALGGGARGAFGSSTLQALGKNLKADPIPPLRGGSRQSVLFNKRFRDDQFANALSGYAALNIGFPP